MHDIKLERYWLWEDEIRERNYQNIYFEEIENFYSEVSLKDHINRYADKVSKATNKKALIEMELAEIKLMNKFEKVGYDAKSIGNNPLFSKENLIKEDLEIFSKTDILLPFEKNFKNSNGRFIVKKYDIRNFVEIDFIQFIGNGIAIAKYEKFLNDQLPLILISSNQPPEIQGQSKKIKWLGNSSHLGYIIYQLANKGFIEFPNYNGEINYTGLAERVLNAFEFKENEPNKKYLSEQINPASENNKISESTKSKLKINIRDLEDLS